LGELWLLNHFVRHEQSDQDRWHWPPADLELNDEVAKAIVACEDGESEYTLLLTRHQLLVVDYCIRADYKWPSPAAFGKAILLKTFRAREGFTVVSCGDQSYEEAKRHAEYNQDACTDAYTDGESDADTGAGPLP